MEKRLELTADGSHTVRMPSMQTTYHSRFGAIQESRHIFIESGFRHYTREKNGPVHIFEMGFGTGLNALLTLLANEEKSESGAGSVWYETIDAFPLNENIAAQLNYGERLSGMEAGKWCAALHRCDWNTPVAITPGFTLMKRVVLLENYDPEQLFDIVYFDAFDPETQPELWTVNIFSRLFRSMAPGGILVTYSSKVSVQRALRAAGFTVEKLPGPPGKREILRAHKIG